MLEFTVSSGVDLPHPTTKKSEKTRYLTMVLLFGFDSKYQIFTCYIMKLQDIIFFFEKAEYVIYRFNLLLLNDILVTFTSFTQSRNFPLYA